jgi:predicted permease
MSDLLADLRYAARALRANPGFTAAAVLTLALGIGATTTIFSVVDGVLLRPAPFSDLDRLVMVWETDRNSGTTREPASIPDFADFHERARQLDRMAAVVAGEVSLAPEAGDPARLAALAGTYEFLPTLGAAPFLGRSFTEDEDRPGAPRVAMISQELWTQLFAGDPAALGRTIRINDVPHAVVGVLPRSADFGMLQILRSADYGRSFAERGGRTRVDIWLPLRADPTTTSRDNHPILVVGRLAAGSSPALAQQELGAIAAELEQAYPSNDGRGAHVEPMRDVIFGSSRPALLVLLASVALVLLVACANVANLLLARGTTRTREVTVRTALGAGTGRLARQFLVEGGVLTFLGAALGVLFAFVGVDLLVALAPATLPRVDTVVIDARVLVATLAVTAVVTLVFGLVPTLQTRRFSLQPVLQDTAGRGGSAGRGQQRARSALVVAELALTAMLMIGAGLLIRSLWQLSRVDPGFAAAGVLKGEFQLPASRYPQSFDNWPRWTEVQRFTTALRQRAAALPGVEVATLAGNHPLEAGFTSSITVVGRQSEAGDWPEPAIRRVDAGYFTTLRVPVLAGRAFTEADDVEAAPVVIINRAAERRYFGAQPPLGQRISLWGMERTVIGIVGDERMHGLTEDVPPAVYLPVAQAPATSGSLLVRVEGDPAGLAGAIRAIARELDPALPLFGVEPLADTVAGSLAQRRFTMLVLGGFAAVALILAMVGVHGVLSYTVAQRTREIGIRVALGADAGAVRALIVGQGAGLAAAGLALGLLGALAGSRWLAALLYGVRPVDPVTFGGVTLALGAIALAATWLPARRAARIAPGDALRQE